MRFPTRQINKKWEKEIEKASNASPTRRVKHFFFVNVNTIIRVSFIESPCASQLLAWYVTNNKVGGKSFPSISFVNCPCPACNKSKFQK